MSRRGFLAIGLAVVAGCATSPQIASLPEPIWPEDDPRRLLPPASPASRAVVVPKPVEAPPPMANVIPRSAWARGGPRTSDMQPMLPVGAITIHHDAMSVFTATDAASSQARIELIRTSHRGRGWSDIGYHFVIDRSGRIYEARPLNWQGAHVQKRNEGNIGVLCLGNFEEQAPSEAQLQALAMHVTRLRQMYRVPARTVLTHREWPGAQTLCPGANLQRRVVVLRTNKAFG
ncbi:MAG TPA: N-acetylmuramoyl-L-alanine amidase [Phycisphaerales bacterium]|nr:N-acetylmuramoyl-L-alanine amidase [Phycisphaerales bacterium]HMP38591.1 N-acetylmuramoyl-L-alanine amidase [Phycisphaerales bacterium]